MSFFLKIFFTYIIIVLPYVLYLTLLRYTVTSCACCPVLVVTAMSCVVCSRLLTFARALYVEMRRSYSVLCRLTCG